MANKKILRGMTWNHTRGYLPLVAASQRFEEIHPEITIQWEKRSLKDFEAFPIEQLAATYDFLVIDHPFVGFASASGCILRLDEHLPADFLADQAAQSVGASHPSYTYAGHRWALALDAATPVACWRPDLMERHGAQPPQDWKELLEFARRGWVELPAVQINCLMNSYMLFQALGETPFLNEEGMISSVVGEEGLRLLKELIDLSAPGGLQRDPIMSYEHLLKSDEAGPFYIPFTYGYSNYARRGYARQVLKFGDVPLDVQGKPSRTTLGGTGLALSSRTEQQEAALAFALYVAGAQCQTEFYVQAGGQPGYRQAWLDAENNRQTDGYFRDTLPTLDRAFVRPRHNGSIPFQEHAGPILHEYCSGHSDVRSTVKRLNQCHLQSLT
jgi:multiple sugar transport system substrate-binding protein